MMTEQDCALLAKKGISEEQLNAQLSAFQTGFPFLQLEGAADLANGGIYAPDAAAAARHLSDWEAYTADADHRVVKFVPASGAASRMFKDLFAFLEADYEMPTTEFERTFFDRLEDAAFLDDLDRVLTARYGKDAAALVAEGKYKAVVEGLLGSEGLNYGRLPKGLLKFHRYESGARTPFEEHLVEGAHYAKDGKGCVLVHFTVSPEHRALFEALAQEKKADLGRELEAEFDISFSEQKPSTDTIAVNADNTPFRNADGTLLFRPGGHGALIENLNDIEADVVFIKNIDRTTP